LSVFNIFWALTSVFASHFTRAGRNCAKLWRFHHNLTISKQGFERFVYSAAFDHPLLYGIIAVIIAVTAGLLASALSRRD